MNTYELNIERFKAGIPIRRAKQFLIPDDERIQVHMMGECDEINEWLLHHEGTILGMTPFMCFWKVSKETQMLFLLKWSSYQ